MKRLLVLSSRMGPDYLADLFYCEMVHSGRYAIETNHLPAYFFSDYPDIPGLYGKGYTVFGKLDRRLAGGVRELASEEIREAIAQRRYDKIVYTSIWRCSEFVDTALAHYPKQDIIVLDGEDLQAVADLSLKTTYYKRELTPQYTAVCRPVSFAYPTYFTPPQAWREAGKPYIVAPCVPHYTKSYIYLTEEAYFRQYARSLFGITTKKAGWDCMRHYEIIKAGAIPYFPDIRDKPPATMSEYPVALQEEANALFMTLMSDPSKAPVLEARIQAVAEEFGGWLERSAHTDRYHTLLA